MRSAIPLYCVSLLVASCGDKSTESVEEQMQGIWSFASDNLPCASLISVDGDEVEVNDACELENGQVGSQVLRGTFEVDGDDILWTITHASCPSLRKSAETMQYSFLSGDRLRLQRSTGVLVYGRPSSKDDDATGMIVYGCWNDMRFTVSPIQRLPE